MKKLFVGLLTVISVAVFGSGVFAQDGKIYTVKNFKFKIEKAAVQKGGFSAGRFAMAPADAARDTANDGVFGVQLICLKGNFGAFSALDTFILNDDGKKIDEPVTALSNDEKKMYTFITYAPLNSKKLKLSHGGKKIDVSPYLQDKK